VIVFRLAEARMDAGTDLLRLHDLLEQRDEAIAIRGAESTRDLLLVFVRDSPGAPEQLAALVGEIEGVNPAIAGMRPTLDQAAALELIDDRDHPAGWRLDRLPDRLLRAALRGVHHVENAEKGRVQIDRREALREAARRVDTDL
jgi:hypothetical protein